MKYATPRIKFLAIVGVVFSLLAGLATPLISIVMGRAIAIYDPLSTPEEISDGIIYLIKMICIIATIIWVTSYLQYALMQHVAEVLASDLRTLYLQALMKQETEFFER